MDIAALITRHSYILEKVILQTEQSAVWPLDSPQ